MKVAVLLTVGGFIIQGTDSYSLAHLQGDSQFRLAYVSGHLDSYGQESSKTCSRKYFQE